jgi:DNA-binding response OmpR family regulator
MAPTILVADDDPKLVRVVSLYLGSRGYRVETAPDGETAYRQATACPPDLIVADIAMPGMDGYELCRRLRRNSSTRTIPFIFLTGRHQDTDRMKARKVGSDDFITKPCPLERLLQSIETLMDRVEQAKTIDLDRIGLAGRIEDVDLLDMIQTVELDQKTGALVLSHGERTATLYFRDGVIVDADIQSPRREEPLFMLLGWKTGRFLFLPDAVPDRMPITASLANLLFQDLQALERHERETMPPASVDEETAPPESGPTARILAGLETLAQQPSSSRAPAPGPLIVRVLVVGVARSGKSALIQSLVKDLSRSRWAAIGTEEPTGRYRTDVGRVRISREVVLHLIAVRAEKRFRPVWEHFLPESHAAIVLLDPSSADALNHIRVFLQATAQLAPQFPIHVLASSQPRIEDLAGLRDSDLSVGSPHDQTLRLFILDRVLQQRLVAH